MKDLPLSRIKRVRQIVRERLIPDDRGWRATLLGLGILLFITTVSI